MKRVDTMLTIEGWGKLGPAIIWEPDVIPDTPLPLIMFLHGGGEWGKQDGSELNKLLAYGLPKQMTAGLQVNAIVCAPQAAESSHQFNSTRWMILQLRKKYKIDDGQIHLTGISYGGGGVWSCVTNEGWPNPEAQIVQLISTIVPVSAMGVMQPTTDRMNEDKHVREVAAKGVSVCAVCGTNDNHYSLQMEYINRIKQNNPLRLSVSIIGITGADHNPTGWEPAYNPNTMLYPGGLNMIQWMLTNGRSARNGQPQPQPVPDPAPVPPAKKLIGTVSVTTVTKIFDDKTTETTITESKTI